MKSYKTNSNSHITTAKELDKLVVSKALSDADDQHSFNENLRIFRELIKQDNTLIIFLDVTSDIR